MLYLYRLIQECSDFPNAMLLCKGAHKWNRVKLFDVPTSKRYLYTFSLFQQRVQSYSSENGLNGYNKDIATMFCTNRSPIKFVFNGSTNAQTRVMFLPSSVSYEVKKICGCCFPVYHTMVAHGQCFLLSNRLYPLHNSRISVHVNLTLTTNLYNLQMEHRIWRVWCMC